MRSRNSGNSTNTSSNDQRPEELGGFHAEQQIFAHRERGKDLTILRHVAQPLARNLVRCEAIDAHAAKGDASDRRHQPHDGLHRSRPARAVAAKKTHDLARADVKRGALQDMTLAVKSVQVVDVKHRALVPR
jgi:hypothetical protein